MRILLADDQPRVRSAIRLLLEQQPETHVVEEVTNKQELLHYVGDCGFDVVLLDWELAGPELENIVTTLRVLCPDLAIIVLDSKPQTRQLALNAGANEFVSKNDPPEQLLSAIAGHWNSTRK